jgi:micrococcal nuclease
VTNFGPYPATVVRVVDGDTVQVRLDLGFSIGFTASCRLYGINAPELRTQEGKDARDFLMTRLAPGDPITVTSYGWDKYGGRFDGRILSGTLDINNWMVDNGHAVVANF